MRIRTSIGRGAFPEEIEEYVRHRFAFALGRFGPRLADVFVRLEDLNGPRGGADKRCTVRVRVQGGGALIVEDTATEARACVDRAADRLHHTVARKMERIRA
jgi:ribosome-associated translation inhibitor RaiA